MWIAEVDIRSLIEKFDEKNMSTIGLEVFTRLKKSGLFPDAYLRPLLDATRYKDLEAFDKALDHVYDFADKRKIWLGA